MDHDKGGSSLVASFILAQDGLEDDVHSFIIIGDEFVGRDVQTDRRRTPARFFGVRRCLGCRLRSGGRR